MELKDKYKLRSHDGTDNWLVALGPEESGLRVYRLDSPSDFSRILYGSDALIAAVDPAGGPMIEVGKSLAADEGHPAVHSIDCTSENRKKFGVALTVTLACECSLAPKQG